MPSIQLEDLSPFGRLAVKLDQEFADLTRAGGPIEHVDLESDNGLAEGIKILNRVAQRGKSIAVTLQEFAIAMQEAQAKADAATTLVAGRAQLIQRRRQQQDQLEERLNQVKAAVKTVGASLAGFAAPVNGVLSEEDRRQVAAELEGLQEPMARFIAAAQEIKDEAARSKFKRLERQADSVIDSLQASRRKIAQVLAPKQA